MAEGFIVQDYYHDFQTVTIYTFVKDRKDELADPTSITVTVYDPDGNVQAEDQAMTKFTDDEDDPLYGGYFYFYHKGTGLDAMQHGIWKYIVIVVDGTGDEAITSAPVYMSFKVGS